jgi:hypothetical protein
MARTTTAGRTTPKGSKGASGPVTSASTWKSKTARGTLITVPSGNTAIVRAPGMQAFLKEGVIPNGLMAIVQESMIGVKKPSEVEMSSILSDPTKFQELLDLADSVTVACCVDPKVSPAPVGHDGKVLSVDDPERDEDVLYVDEVDFNDKMFIFNFAVGGTADLEQFRT